MLLLPVLQWRWDLWIFFPPVSEVSRLPLLYSQGTRRVAAVSYRVMVISQTHPSGISPLFPLLLLIKASNLPPPVPHHPYSAHLASAASDFVTALLTIPLGSFASGINPTIPTQAPRAPHEGTSAYCPPCHCDPHPHWELSAPEEPCSQFPSSPPAALLGSPPRASPWAHAHPQTQHSTPSPQSLSGLLLLLGSHSGTHLYLLH